MIIVKSIHVYLIKINIYIDNLSDSGVTYVSMSDM